MGLISKRESAQEVLEFRVSNFNILVAFLGGFLSLFGLVSYLIKEKFYLSECLISLLTGLTFSPHAANWIRPLEYAENSQANVDSITLYFSRLVLGVQLVLAGIQLPSRYLKKEWKSLSYLLGPGMCAMWISSSLLVWAMVPNFSFLNALAVGACITPTDPVLSNTIVKGKFADKNIPPELQKVIVGESGANDGLGYPFLFLSLYTTAYTGDHGLGETGGARKAMGYWFGVTWGYEIAMSIIWGGFVGWLFQKMLHWAEDQKYVDRESFLVFAISIALFIVGTVGMVGSDDVLACFIAGNTFTWDDWFRRETEDDSFQPTIDMLLNVTIFLWYGAICPWAMFAHNNVIPIYRLIFLAILVLLFRRLPVVLLMHKRIHQIEDLRQACFVGFFGPVGVSAIFYLYTSLDYLQTIQVDGRQREDAAQLAEVITVVVWFMAVCSIIVHGLTIPLGKLGFHIPRTISRAISVERGSDADADDDEPEPFRIREHAASEERNIEAGLSRLRGRSCRSSRAPEGNTNGSTHLSQPTKVFKIGGTVMKDLKPSSSISLDHDAKKGDLGASSSGSQSQVTSPTAQRSRQPSPSGKRAIKFPDQTDDRE